MEDLETVSDETGGDLINLGRATIDLAKTAWEYISRPTSDGIFHSNGKRTDSHESFIKLIIMDPIL